MSKLSDKYKCEKVGFVIDVSDDDKMYKYLLDTYKTGVFLNIQTWELLKWTAK